jgi:hypothetical protein
VTAPAAGATVSGSVTLAASATDDTGVAGVRFEVDGTAVGAEDTSAPYTLAWASTGVANGTHSVRAVARDAAGNTATSAAVTVTVSNTTTPPPSGGLVAAWSFNEGAGATLTDSSGRGNNGSVVGPTWTTAGKYGGALSFDGTNDYVTVPDSASLDLGSTMTMEAWVRPTASSGWRTVLLKESPTDLAYALYSASGTNRPSVWVDGASSVGTAALTTSAWSHVAATYNGSRLRIYVNGTLRTDKAVTSPVPVTSGPLKIGGNAIWGEWFAGQVDEVRIYDRALTAAEITADMGAPQ